MYTIRNMTHKNHTLSRDEIVRLAHLAKLDFTDTEIEQLGHEIGAVLGYIDQLKQVSLGDKQPTKQVTGLVNVMRKDAPINYGASPADLIANVPKTNDNYIQVKRVLQ